MIGDFHKLEAGAAAAVSLEMCVCVCANVPVNRY